jgi:hypothetical protein
MFKKNVFFASLFTVSCISATPSLSEDIPRYDVESYCKQVSDVSGGSAMINNSCIDMEQEAYNNLKSNWDAVAEKTQSYCDQVAGVTGGSYNILQSCIDMENNASNNAKSFQY